MSVGLLSLACFTACLLAINEKAVNLSSLFSSFLSKKSSSLIDDSAAIFTLKSLVSNKDMLPTPFIPDLRESVNVYSSLSIGEITPIPVITTLLVNFYLLFSI